MIFACQIYFLAALLSFLPIHRSFRESFDFFYDPYLQLFTSIDAAIILTKRDIQIMCIVQIGIVGKESRRSIRNRHKQSRYCSLMLVLNIYA